MNEIIEDNEFSQSSLLDLTEMKYTADQDFTEFYLSVRTHVSNHLKRRGDKVLFGSYELLEDEILSPTFEDMIVLICLEKIDPKLPQQVKTTFYQQLMETKSSLLDLQKEIFEVIPVMLDIQCTEKAPIESVPLVSLKMVVKEEDSSIEKVVIEQVLKEEDLDLEAFHQKDSYNQDEKTDISSKKLVEKGTNLKPSKFKCTKCDKEFDTKKKLTDHKRQHKVQEYSCKICDKSFSCKKDLIDHNSKDHNEDSVKENVENKSDAPVDEPLDLNDEISNENEVDIDNVPLNIHNKQDIIDTDKNEETKDEKSSTTCKICNKTFKSEKHLGWHQRYHRVDSVPHTCDVCNKSFTTKRKLNDHKMSHKVELCVCEVCNQTFDRRKYLINHRYKHHKQHECSLCEGIIMHGKSEYDAHMKERHGQVNVAASARAHKEKKHPCEICGKFFQNLNYLKIHLERHEKKLSCTICDIKFETKKLHSIHMNNLHKPAKVKKELPCEFCGKLFTSVHILKKHLQTHAEGWNQLRCETCSRVFSSQEQMGSHICKHFSCDVCSKRFVRVRNLEFHKREHAGEVMHHCDSCEALFDKKKRLAEHKRFVHKGVRRYKCEVCDREFAVKSGLNNHMLIHTGERPYKCEECNQTFRLKGSLDMHNKMHTNELPFSCDGCNQRFRMLGNLKQHREAKMCGFSEGDLFRNKVEN